MKKKTKKFYFSNSAIKNPAVNSLFCFSSRGLRQNRHIKISFKYRKKKKYIYRYEHNTLFYKKLVRRKIIFNNLNLNKAKIKIYFINSFFLSHKFVYKHKKTLLKLISRLKLWFNFKTKYNRFFKKKTIRYRKCGILSSQVAHVLSRKNISYQVWSKYRSNIVNMAVYDMWLYTCANNHLMYSAILLELLYNFSSDPQVRPLYYDEEFNTIISSTFNINLRGPNKFFRSFLDSHSPLPTGPLNVDNNLEHVKTIFTNYVEIESALQRYEAAKKADPKKELDLNLTIGINKNSIILISRFFILTEFNSNNIHLNKNLIFFISIYNVFWKL